VGERGVGPASDEVDLVAEADRHRIEVDERFPANPVAFVYSEVETGPETNCGPNLLTIFISGLHFFLHGKRLQLGQTIHHLLPFLLPPPSTVLLYFSILPLIE
jgi:hypothetical protein